MTRTDSTPVPAFPDLLRLDGRGVVLVGAQCTSVYAAALLVVTRVIGSGLAAAAR